VTGADKSLGHDRELSGDERRRTVGVSLIREHSVTTGYRSSGNTTNVRRVAHFLFNFSEGDPERAAARLAAKMWGSAATSDIATSLPRAMSL
jgi:hypothetical protein